MDELKYYKNDPELFKSNFVAHYAREAMSIGYFAGYLEAQLNRPFNQLTADERKAVEDATYLLNDGVDCLNYMNGMVDKVIAGDYDDTGDEYLKRSIKSLDGEIDAFFLLSKCREAFSTLSAYITAVQTEGSDIKHLLDEALNNKEEKKDE